MRVCMMPSYTRLSWRTLLGLIIYSIHLWFPIPEFHPVDFDSGLVGEFDYELSTGNRIVRTNFNQIHFHLFKRSWRRFLSRDERLAFRFALSKKGEQVRIETALCVRRPGQWSINKNHVTFRLSGGVTPHVDAVF